MKIKLTYHNQKPIELEAEFNQVCEPHLTEVGGVVSEKFTFTTLSELERFKNREKKCRAVTMKNEKVKLVLVERI